MIKKYAYVMVAKDNCVLCDDNSVYTSNNEIPVPDLMILMLRDGAETCELYKTNGLDDIDQWSHISTFGGPVGNGIFNSLS